MIASADAVKDYSQYGEQAILFEILAKLPTRDHWCVDVGAGNGFSNVRALIERCDYQAVLFEPKREEARALQALYDSNFRVQISENYVGFETSNYLDGYLVISQIPFDFDFLSIDIDGNDYHAWNAVVLYRPKVVCIEFNPTIPNEVHFVQPADMKVAQGCSLVALVELGKRKGYALVACTRLNAFFVRTDLFEAMGVPVPNNDYRILRTDISLMTFVFTGYDGHIFLAGNERLPWHPIYWTESRLQLMPKYFQRLSWTYTPFQRFLFTAWRRCRHYLLRR